MSMKSKSRSRDAAKTPSALQCRRSESSSLGNTKVQQQPAQNFFSHNEQKSIDSYFSSKLSRSIENLTKSTDMLKLSKSANAPAKTNGKFEQDQAFCKFKSSSNSVSLRRLDFQVQMQEVQSRKSRKSLSVGCAFLRGQN